MTPEEDETVNKDGDGEDDEILRFPPPYLVPDDPMGRNFGFENDGPDEEDSPTTGGDSPTDNGGKRDFPGDDSSGFREELEDRSEYDAKAESMDSGVIEQELEQENVQLMENVPANPNNVIVPPMYSAAKKDRRSSQHDNNFYSDMLGEAREGAEASEETHQNLGFRNDGGSLKSDKLASARREEADGSNYETMEASRRGEGLSFDDVYENLKDLQSLPQTESIFSRNFDGVQESLQQKERAKIFDETFDSYIRENAQSSSKENKSFELQQAISKYPNLPVPDFSGPRILPTPAISYAKQQQSSTVLNDYSETRYYTNDKSSSSQSSKMVNEYEDFLSRDVDLSLPSAGLHRVSVTKPVELTLRRSAYEALQKRNNEGEFGSEAKPIRRNSIPIIMDGPFGKQMKEIRLKRDNAFTSTRSELNRDSSTLLSYRSFEDISKKGTLFNETLATRRNLSESNLIGYDKSIESKKQKVKHFPFSLSSINSISLPLNDSISSSCHPLRRYHH